MPRFLSLGLIVALAFGAWGAPRVAWAGSLVFSSLDVVGQTAGAAAGIDARGRVVGTTTDAAGVSHGLVWSAGVTTLVDGPGRGTVLGAINSAGVVAGSSATGSVPDGVFVEKLSAGVAKPVSASTANAYFVSGLNRAGVMTGTALTSGFSSSAFITAGRRLSLLAVPGATLSYGSAINSAGTIVGQYADAASVQHGYSYAGGVFTMIDTTLGKAIGTALTFITDTGIIGGSYLTPSCSLTTCPALVHGLVRRAGVDRAYDFPGKHRSTTVIGVSVAGEVVGNFADPTVQGSENTHGFIYRAGVYHQIDMPGALYTSIAAVNAAGSIAGTYIDAQLVTHGFVAICPAGSGGCVN